MLGSACHGLQRLQARKELILSADVHLRRALDLASEHSAGGRCGPFGAVVVRDGEVLGEGWNQVLDSSDPTAHAEVVAIRAACARLATHDLAGATLYCSCEPCPMCLGALLWARIGRVVFAAGQEDAAAAGFDDKAFYEEASLPWGDRGAVTFEQQEREAGVAVLEAWGALPHREIY